MPRITAFILTGVQSKAHPCGEERTETLLAVVCSCAQLLSIIGKKMARKMKLEAQVTTKKQREDVFLKLKEKR